MANLVISSGFMIFGEEDGFDSERPHEGMSLIPSGRVFNAFPVKRVMHQFSRSDASSGGPLSKRYIFAKENNLVTVITSEQN